MALMKAAQIHEAGGDFELVRKEIPEPKESEVRIKVQACGVCHGEAVVKEGTFPDINYPRVPGHEVVGTIDKLGANVAVWETGQRVGVGWYGGPCLECEACRMGDPSKCTSFLTTGVSFDGGFAEYMVAPIQALSLIPPELDSFEAAPLLCAGRTSFSALRHSGAKAGDLVAIQGIGGLGHLGVQFARLLGFRTVALSRGTDKRDLAYILGAHVYIDTEATNPAAELQKLGGARVILATAPNGKTISDVVNGFGFEGELIIVAYRGDPIRAFAWQLLGDRRSIRGWTARPARIASEDVLNFSVISGARPMIEVFPLEQAALAYEKMMNAKVRFRAVLKISE